MHDSLRFWAKTFPASAGGVAFKPVLHHLLDVAAVAASYLHLQSARLAREAALRGVSAEEYIALVAFLSGLHDLGKFTRNFQAKVESLWPAALGTWPGANAVGLPHWRATGLMLQLDPFRAPLASLLPNLADGRSRLACGHRGPSRPTAAGLRQRRRRPRSPAQGAMARLGLYRSRVLRLRGTASPDGRATGRRTERG